MDLTDREFELHLAISRAERAFLAAHQRYMETRRRGDRAAWIDARNRWLEARDRLDQLVGVGTDVALTRLVG